MSKQGTPFNTAAVSRITSATAKANGGQILPEQPVLILRLTF